MTIQQNTEQPAAPLAGVTSGEQPKGLPHEGFWPDLGKKGTEHDLAAGLLYCYADSLLLIEGEGEDPGHALIAGATGVWQRNDSQLLALIGVVARHRADTIVMHNSKGEVDDAKTAKAQSTLLEKAGGYLFRQRVIKALYASSLEWRDVKPAIEGLTVCREEDLNLHGSIHAFTNGVVDLKDHRDVLLPPEEARQYLCTRVNRVEYHPDARTDLVDLLLANYGERPGAFMLANMGHAMHRTPGRRLPALWGDTGSGKTTLFKVYRDTVPHIVTSIDPGAFSGRTSSSAGLSPQFKPMIDGHAIVYVDETLASATDTDLTKNLTGGGYITCRGLYEKQVATVPLTATLFSTSNAPPQLDFLDEAMLARLAPIELPSLPEGSVIEDVAQQIAASDEHKQALVAVLLRAARDNPAMPAKPDWMQAETEAMQSEVMGHTSDLLREHLRIMPGASISTLEIWNSVLALQGRPYENLTTDDMTQSSVTRLVRHLFKLPKAKSIRRGGMPCRGWTDLAWTSGGA